MTIETLKKEIREKTVLRVKQLSKVEKERASQIISNALISNEKTQKASRICCYLPLENEVVIHTAIIKWLTNGKAIYIPKHYQDTYHIVKLESLSEPNHTPQFSTAPLTNYKERIDTWIIPGIAFDTHRNRLGRGKGIYDTLLSNSLGKKIGVCFNAQRVESIPTQSHDIPVDTILSA